MKMTKPLVTIILSITLLLSGCFRQGSSKQGGTVNLKVGYVPIADCLQLYVANDKGLFTKQGLSVELLPLQSGPKIIEALSSKSVDVGISNVVSTIIGHSKGLPIVGITGGPVETEGHKTHALLVLESSPITNPKNLEGKTVAVNALRNSEHVMLRQYLEKNGVSVDSVKVVEAPFPQMEGVLKNGSVDAVMAIEPYITLAQNNKSVRVLGYPYTDVNPRSIVSIYDVRSDWLEQNPDTARKFAAAIAEATDFINNNGNEARQILLKYTKIPQEVADKVVITEFQARSQPGDLQHWIDELARQGIIDKPFQAQEAFRQP
jgi:NitT/TauT family transport system substrate-binding protein